MGRYYQCILLMLLFLGQGCGPKKEKETAPKAAVPGSTEMVSQKPADSIFNNGERILFKGSGNEPFWGLVITEKSLVFTSITEGLESFHAPITKPIMAMDANVKAYRSQSETGGSIQVQLAQMLCTDDMSGKISDHQVEVTIKRAKDPDSIVFKGCGNYRTDYRLQDIWVLEEMGGKPVDKEDFTQQVPYLEINSSQNTFLGHAGCNRMSGEIWNEGSLLRFSKITLTRKACGPENKEAPFLQHLESSTYYKVKENRLWLSNPDGTSLVFKKID